jgi:predicted aldo/keto reductase-like oxidoreductase
MDALKHLNNAKTYINPIETKLYAEMEKRCGNPLPWHMHHCIPPWQKCPEQLNLRVMHWLSQLYIGWNLTEYVKMRLNLLGNGGHWFPGTEIDKLDKVTDTQLLKTLKNCSHPHNIIQSLRKLTKELKSDKVKRLSEQK